MRAELKGPLARTYPVSAAAEAVVRGIERRSRIVACPRRLLIALMAIKPLLPWLTEREMRGRASPTSTALAEREVAAKRLGPGGRRRAAELAG